MTFKEHMAVEKWKDVPTEDIITLMAITKGFMNSTKESVLFYVGLAFFLVAPLAVTTICGFTTDAMIGFTVAFISYIFVWKFFIRKKFYNEDAINDYKKSIEEFEAVLKYRD